MSEGLVEEKGKIVVKCVPRDTTRDELIQLFCAIGPLKEVILPKPKVFHQTVFAFVTFQDERDTVKAISQYQKFEFCNSSGRKSALYLEQAYKRDKRLPTSGLNCASSASSLWSVGSQESDSASVGSDTAVGETSASANHSMEFQKREEEWTKEKRALLEIIAENDRKITELHKKKGEQLMESDKDLDLKEKQLLEELERLPKKISILNEEIEVLQLQVKLKELEKEQSQLLNK